MNRSADGRRFRAAGGAALVATSAAALAAGAASGKAGVAFVPAFASEVLRLDFAATAPAVPFLILIGAMVPAVASWTLARGRPGDGWRLALFTGTMIGVLLAQSVAAFFFAWELMSLVSALLVGTHHERRDVRRALFSYVLVSQLGALCIAAGLAALAAHAGSFRFADIAAAAATLPAGLRSAVMLLMLVGFGSKAGLLPLHFWLPRAHPVAPANASALLSGAMLNVAAYGLMLAAFRLVAPLPLGWGVGIIFLGALTALLGALYAAVDSDFKRLLAYSSVENLGIIASVLGLAVLATAVHEPAVAQLARIAFFVHAGVHGIFKSLLFLGAGTLTAAAQTSDLEQLGGLRGALPLTAPLFLVGCMAAAALPPTAGFVSEWLVFAAFIQLLGTAASGIGILAAIAIAMLAAASGLAALAFAKLFGVAFLGTLRSSREIKPERPDPALAGLGWLTLGCLAIGIAPALLLSVVNGIAAAAAGGTPLDAAAIPRPPVSIGILPLLGGVAAMMLARARGVRNVPTWTCGSAVTARSQYTATAFSKPVRRIFGFVLFPDHHEIRETGASAWFPLRIRYAFTTRYVFDDAARYVAAVAQRLARRMRIVQAGLLRVYLVYAVVAVLIVLVAAR